MTILKPRVEICVIAAFSYGLLLTKLYTSSNSTPPSWNRSNTTMHQKGNSIRLLTGESHELAL